MDEAGSTLRETDRDKPLCELLLPAGSLPSFCQAALQNEEVGEFGSHRCGDTCLLSTKDAKNSGKARQSRTGCKK